MAACSDSLPLPFPALQPLLPSPLPFPHSINAEASHGIERPIRTEAQSYLQLPNPHLGLWAWIGLADLNQPSKITKPMMLCSIPGFSNLSAPQNLLEGPLKHKFPGHS